jgi:hypothetical protein
MLMSPFKVLDILIWPGSTGRTRGVGPAGAILG